MCQNRVLVFICGHLVEQENPVECDWPKSTGRHSKHCPNWKNAHVERIDTNCGRCTNSFELGINLDEDQEVKKPSFWAGCKHFFCCIDPDTESEIPLAERPACTIPLADIPTTAGNIPLLGSPIKAVGPEDNTLPTTPSADATTKKEGPLAPVIDITRNSWVAPKEW